MARILYKRLSELKGTTKPVDDMVDLQMAKPIFSRRFLSFKDQSERYLIFQEDGNSKEYTYEQIIKLIFANKIQHHTTIQKVSIECWTKAGILLEFREALKIQIKNNR